MIDGNSFIPMAVPYSLLYILLPHLPYDARTSLVQLLPFTCN